MSGEDGERKTRVSDRSVGGIGQDSEEAADHARDSRMRLMARRWIQRKAAARQPQDAATKIPEASASLPRDVRARMEPQLGADLSGVKISTSGQSAEAADHLGARAFTVGEHVHFGAGQYAPSTKDGDHLLAHELAHTVQGRNSGIQRKEHVDATKTRGDQALSQPGDPAEVEADAVADRAAGHLHDSEPSSPRSLAAAAPPIAAKLKDGAILRMPKVGADHDEAAEGQKSGGKDRRKPGSLGQAKGTDALRQENKVVRDVVVELKLDKDQARTLHDAISGQGLDYHGIKAMAQSLFPKGGKAK